MAILGWPGRAAEGQEGGAGREGLRNSRWRERRAYWQSTGQLLALSPFPAQTPSPQQPREQFLPLQKQSEAQVLQSSPRTMPEQTPSPHTAEGQSTSEIQSQAPGQQPSEFAPSQLGSL